jgi:hypothetical protein
MKKTVSAIKVSFFVAVIVIFSVSISSCASTPKGKTDDGFKYTIKDNSVIITGYSGKTRDLVIPGLIEGLPVTEIGERAFAGKKLASVVFPETLVAIGAEAFSFGEFSSKNYITNITLPKNIKKIGSLAFNVNSLTTIEVNHELDVKEEMGLPEHFTAWYLVHGGKTGVYTYQDGKWLLNGKSPPSYNTNFAVITMRESIYLVTVDGNAGSNYAIERKSGDIFFGDYNVYILPAGKYEIGLRYYTRNYDGSGISSDVVKYTVNVATGESYIAEAQVKGINPLLGDRTGTISFSITKQ